MKTTAQTSAIETRPAPVGLGGTLAALFVAGLTLVACAQTHHARPATLAAAATEFDVAQPQAALDYSMRLDLSRGRLQVFDTDARLAGVVPLQLHGCDGVAPVDLADGLWLVVPRADGGIELLATGSTRSPESVTVSDCGADTAALDLPESARQRMAARGGVLYVDRGQGQNPVAPLQRALADKVP